MMVVGSRSPPRPALIRPPPLSRTTTLVVDMVVTAVTGSQEMIEGRFVGLTIIWRNIRVIYMMDRLGKETNESPFVDCFAPD